MKDRGSVKPDISSVRQAGVWLGRQQSIHIWLENLSQSMRAEDDFQWRILNWDRVDVDASGKHSLDQREGWLDMVDTAFLSPSTVTLNLMPARDWNGSVLMPAERPV